MKNRPNHLCLLLTVSLLLWGSYSLKAQQKASAPTDKATGLKIEQLISKMTLQEKINMLHGNALFSSDGIKRLNVPELTFDDGPLGVREEVLRFDWASARWTTDSATFFPNGSAVAATWNPALANRFGVAMGQEANARKKIVMLAPAFNICRMPLCGRTYEYYSEDPFLNAQLAVQSVLGIQSQHVAACIKHFALNNQETKRNTVNVVADERTMREIYLPAFKAAVQQGNAYTLMAAYNKVNGYWCSENDFLLNRVLKKEWGFKGLVVSDWGGTHSSAAAANSGLDIEMGSSGPYDQWHFATPLLTAVKAGQVSEKTINEKVRRILWVMYQTSLSQHRPAGSISTSAHSKTVYDIAAESIVLLKNENHLLPLKAGTYKSIAVIGDNATRTFALGGFGAGVKAKYEVTALQGLKAKLGSGVKIQFAQGYRANWMASKSAAQNAASALPDTALIAQAAALAKSSDIALLFVGSNREYESEGNDRPDLSLPFGEQSLIDAVTAANPNTIVIVIGGAPYDINKIKQVNHTIVWSWFNGSEGGNALADVLTGAVNPSGKLPFTFPVSLDDSPTFALHTFPGDSITADYKEGLLVGYRWYDTKKIAPLYPFGYGLSYTDFTYKNLKTDRKSYKSGDRIAVTLTLTNSGKVGGKETVQLYIAKQGSAVSRAEKELKAFTKVDVAPGASKSVQLLLNTRDLAYYNITTHSWTVEPGKYSIMAGSSSRDIRGVESFVIQ